MFKVFKDELDDGYNDVENLITRKFVTKANYKIDTDNNFINCYLLNDDRVIIMGMADNNYAFWISITDSQDLKANEEVYNAIRKYIDKENYKQLAYGYTALEEQGISYERLSNSYNFRFIKTTVKGMAWKTEFGHYYGAEQEETNGSIFASNIKELPNQLKRRCEIREAGGNYLSVLNYYEMVYDNLSGGAVERYESFKNIIDILDSEKYLICSDNSEVRKKYIELKKKGAGLYNSYMTAVR